MRLISSLMSITVLMKNESTDITKSSNSLKKECRNEIKITSNLY